MQRNMLDITNGQEMALQATEQKPDDPTIIYMKHESKCVVPTTLTRTIITTEDDFNLDLNGYIFESDIKIEESVLQEFKQPMLVEYMQQDRTAADDEFGVLAVVKIEKLATELMSNDSQKAMVFECYVCRYTASSRIILKKHLRSHPPVPEPVSCPRKVSIKVRKLSKELMEQFLLQTTNMLECSICGYRTTRKNYLKTHMLSHKPLVERFSCDQCDKIFSVEKSLRAHKRLRHNGQIQSYACRTCNKTFGSSFYLKIHEAGKHTGERKYSCKLCPKKFLYVSNLRNHQNVHSEERSFVCRICSSAYKRAESLRTHLRSHTGERPYACNYDKCDRSFKSQTALKKHERTHTPFERPFECSTCSRKFAQKYVLQAHMKTHTGVKSHICEFCSQSFAEKSTLDNHRRGYHTLERPFKCNVCPKSFSRNSTLHDHRKSHSDARPYPCSICSKAFKVKTALRTHEKTHDLKNRIYSCNRCSAAFACKRSLIGHRRTGDNRFHCVRCGERFEWMCDFKKHVCEKKFECDLCSKEFDAPGKMMKHKKRVHSVERPYSCSTCPMKFGTRSSLKEHISTKHAV